MCRGRGQQHFGAEFKEEAQTVKKCKEEAEPSSKEEENSIKVETGKLKVNLTREEDVIEAAAADDVGALKVEEEVVWLRVATFEIKTIFH